MKSFIFVSFAFLAFAFYILSDGADFQPPVAPTPPVDDSQTAAAPPAIQPAETLPGGAATLVASPVIASGNDALPPAAETAVNDPALQASANLEQIGTSFGQGLSQGLSLFPESDPIIQPMVLASLAQGVSGLRDAPITQGEPEAPQVAEPVAPPADIREVRGTRVNMRDGPGTIYPVIMRLTLGKEVEVLGDSGTGWLRLRVLPERTVGWIAASLISKAGQ